MAHPTMKETTAALLGAALLLVATPYILLAAMPMLGFLLHTLHVIRAL